MSRARNEEIEQARFIRWTHLVAVRDVIPELRWIHHSPNGGLRNKIVAGQMKALGTKPGFPDLILPCATKPPGLALEFKSATGRATEDQHAWLDHLDQAGWTCVIVRSAEQARTAVLDFYRLDPGRLPDLT